jgi:hypothetical protein
MRSRRVAMTLGALIPLVGAALWPIPARANPTSVTVAGDLQSELGCPGDWQPDCLRSWLEDPNGTGVHAFTTDAIPAGDYQGKVAINESWSENYGVGGAPDGATYDFHVAASGDPVSFRYDGVTHLLTIEIPEPDPAAAALAGLAALRLRFRRSRTR